MNLDFKENWFPLLLAAILGTGGGSGAATALFGGHSHPEIILEIREVQYESQIYALETQVGVMEDKEHKDTAAYAVALAQLIKFKDMLTELHK